MRIDKTYYNNQQALAEMLNDSSIDRVMAINTDWQVIAWNATSVRLTGLEKKDVIGKLLIELFPSIFEDDEIIAAIKQAFSGFKVFVPSATGLFNRHYTENHFIPLKDNSGTLIGVMNIMHDVAHRLKVEKQLESLNTELEKKYRQLHKATQDLASFTYIAGHDIQEPVRHVYTALELIARNEGTSLSNTSRASMRKMQTSLNRINLLMSDILTIAKISQQKMAAELVDLNFLLKKLKEEMAAKLETKGVVMHVEALPVVKGFPDLLHYLFHHFIDNAIKFQIAGQQPVIHIKSRITPAQESSQNTESYYEITIADNGIGFDSTEADRIFNMFERLHPDTYKGSGIGLALCQKIMEQHDGTISTESVPGKGSTFSCFFPVPN